MGGPVWVWWAGVGISRRGCGIREEATSGIMGGLEGQCIRAGWRGAKAKDKEIRMLPLPRALLFHVSLCATLAGAGAAGQRIRRLHPSTG